MALKSWGFSERLKTCPPQSKRAGTKDWGGRAFLLTLFGNFSGVAGMVFADAVLGTEWFRNYLVSRAGCLETFV